MQYMIRATVMAVALTLLVAVPAMAQGGPEDDAIQGAQLRERVVEQTQERLGSAVQEGEQLQVMGRTQTRTRAQVQDCDGTPVQDCTGDQLRTRLQDRDQTRHCTECDGEARRLERRMWHRLSCSVQSPI
jgi:hypothetical protein